MKNIIVFFSLLLLGSLLAVAHIMASAPSDACPYTVQKGDTLGGIATTLTGKPQNYPLIMEFNALASDRIAPGQVLHIPFDLLLPEHRCQPEATPIPASLSKITLAAEPTSSSALPAPPVPTLTPPPKGKKFLAEIEAFVFEDTNGNNQFDDGEPAIAGVKLILVKGRVDQPPLTGIIGITGENGKFLFTHVDPGPRAVGLYETTLPHGAALLTESTVMVTVPEGGKSYVKFAVQIDVEKSL